MQSCVPSNIGLIFVLVLIFFCELLAGSDDILTSDKSQFILVCLNNVLLVAAVWTGKILSSPKFNYSCIVIHSRAYET